jgi:hypothetical protein
MSNRIVYFCIGGIFAIMIAEFRQGLYGYGLLSLGLIIINIVFDILNSGGSND